MNARQKLVLVLIESRIRTMEALMEDGHLSPAGYESLERHQKEYARLKAEFGAEDEENQDSA